MSKATMSCASNADELLAALREMPDPSEHDIALKHRLQSRLALSIGGLLPVTSSGSETHSVHRTTSHSGFGAHTDPSALATPRGTSHTDPSALATPLGNALTSSGVLRASKDALITWLVPVFVAGAAVGVAADRWYLRHHTTVMHSARHLEMSSTQQRRFDSIGSSANRSKPSQDALEPLREHVNEPTATRDAPTATRDAPTATSGATSAEPIDSLTTEREILDAARTALARGEPESGITALKKHIRRFPRGTLSEEREALYVRILVAMGDDGSAKARAARFRRQFPNSIFMPVIERALMTISRRTTEGEPKP
ncbi:MAG: hypothetical protein QM784_37890 [Polyangiaceae bacterium]